MSNTSSNPVLSGIRGIDLGELVLIFAKDKFVLTSKGLSEHFTLHLGPNSKVLDVHKTFSTADGPDNHVTLFSISHANLQQMMQEIAQEIVNALIGLARPLHLARMAKQRVGAIVGLLPNRADMSAVTKVHHQKLAIDPKKLVGRAWAPEYLEELYELEEGEIFTLFSCPRGHMPHKIGYAFAVTDGRQRRSLIWVPDKRVSEAIQRIEGLLQDAASRYGSFHT